MKLPHPGSLKIALQTDRVSYRDTELSRYYEICVKEFEEKCVKKMILSERNESTHF